MTPNQKKTIRDLFFERDMETRFFKRGTTQVAEISQGLIVRGSIEHAENGIFATVYKLSKKFKTFQEALMWISGMLQY